MYTNIHFICVWEICANCVTHWNKTPYISNCLLLSHMTQIIWGHTLFGGNLEDSVFFFNYSSSVFHQNMCLCMVYIFLCIYFRCYHDQNVKKLHKMWGPKMKKMLIVIHH